MWNSRSPQLHQAFRKIFTPRKLFVAQRKMRYTAKHIPYRREEYFIEIYIKFLDIWLTIKGTAINKIRYFIDAAV